MISPLTINKALRQSLAPVLSGHGFELVKARKAWGWHAQAVRVLEVDNVGNAFAKATGWPMHSLRVTVGLWTASVAESAANLPGDEQGRRRPDISACQHRLQLHCTLNQRVWQSQLLGADERERTDIWWIADDGSNLDAATRNIADSFLTQALPWLEQLMQQTLHN